TRRRRPPRSRMNFAHRRLRTLKPSAVYTRRSGSGFVSPLGGGTAMKRLTVCLAWTILCVSTAIADDIGFIEDFALAKDRGASLRKLIPGTEDYYYFHAL